MKGVDRYEIVGALVATLIVGPLAWWAMDRDPPLAIVGAPRLVSRGPVAPGASLWVAYRGSYLRRCSGEGQRVFVDATHHVMQIDPYQFRDGIDRDGRPVTLGVERAMAPIAAPVPYGAAPGPATFQMTTQFYCNPLQKALRWGITFRYPLVDFAIAAGAARTVAAPETVFAPVRPARMPRILSDEVPPPPATGDEGK